MNLKTRTTETKASVTTAINSPKKEIRVTQIHDHHNGSTVYMTSTVNMDCYCSSVFLPVTGKQSMDIIVLSSMAKACLCSPFSTRIFPLSKTSIVMWTMTARQCSQQCDQSLEAKFKRKHTSLAGSSSYHSTRIGSGHGTFLSFKEVYYYSKTCNPQFQSCCFVR